MRSRLSARAAELFREMESARHESVRVLAYRVREAFQAGNAKIDEAIDRYLLLCGGMDYAEQRRPLTARQMSKCRDHFRAWLDAAESSPLGWPEGVVSRVKSVAGNGRLSRLDLLLLELSCIVLELYDGLDAEEARYHARAVRESWDWTLWCTYTASGYGRDYEGIDEDVLWELLYGPSTADFEERLRAQRSDCDSGLRLRVRAAIAGGRATELREETEKWLRLKVVHVQTRSRTDNTEYSTAAQREAYADMGVGKLMVWNPLDERTTPICWDMYGTILTPEECVPWETAPPFHYNCRSVLIPAEGVDPDEEDSWREFRRSLVDWRKGEDE